ncbi:DUF2950 domain-containing protein [Methyloligella sp. 2.7D]|uniref:DUF2950 domain-containing protein n=1 Tax=unclassified Methyloligella TaxID=2625955 RepID=UPI00157CE49D|nr:DUF2950 domain-containing protein [Methyloligella sp. GL2]QKP78433.1 DUF2950 domain-containing protein [Methyloligella sp. GL2]
MSHALVTRRWLPALFAVLAFWCAPALAQEKFDSPEAAADALVSAAKQADRKAVLDILGPDGRDVVQSGDKVADRNARDAFIAGYEKKHSMHYEGDDTSILIIGEDSWPFPIPIVKKDGEWEFDSAAGLDEILLRRIGRNELSAIQASLAYVAAQNDYAALDIDGKAPPPYAQFLMSAPGKKDGLYWATKDGETPSPLGALFADASAEGYEFGEEPKPYHGYYYCILTSQGPDAEGGAYDYVVDGRMIGGFALLAYPAAYGNSGIMTFMVNHDGVVFQKDLGEDTDALADKIESFDPDTSWTKVDLDTALQ